MDENKFGTVEHNGKIITLEEEATLTNRVFPGWWGDATSDEPEYTTEYSARGVDDDGNEVTVYWMFPETKGEELEDESNYPWEMVARVEPN